MLIAYILSAVHHQIQLNFAIKVPIIHLQLPYEGFQLVGQTMEPMIGNHDHHV